MANTNQVKTAATATRKDPKPRSMRANAIGGHVIDKRDDRAYKWANPNDESFGLVFCLADGWNKVNAKIDKERGRLGRVADNGEDVIWKGQVLVWMDKEEFDSRDAERGEFVERHEMAKQRPGGIDAIVGPDGELATNM